VGEDELNTHTLVNCEVTLTPESGIGEFVVPKKEHFGTLQSRKKRFFPKSETGFGVKKVDSAVHCRTYTTEDTIRKLSDPTSKEHRVVQNFLLIWLNLNMDESN
jgi:hypothetical protein